MREGAPYACIMNDVAQLLGPKPRYATGSIGSCPPPSSSGIMVGVIVLSYRPSYLLIWLLPGTK